MKSFRAGRATPTTAGYKAFHPELINRPFRLDDMELQGLLEQATLKLGELNAFGELVPNIGHFIRMHVYKEATVSSKIEGTQTNMEEALLDERAVSTELLKTIRARFRRRGIPMPPANRRQAYLLSGARPLANEVGTAPGQRLDAGEKTLFLFPGPGSELKPMVARDLAPFLSGRGAPARRCDSCRCGRRNHRT